MTPKSDLIVSVLNDHPDLTSFEEVQAECARRGTQVGLWAVYYAAKSAGHKLVRRPLPQDKQEVIRDIALTFLGLHKSIDDAIATLEKVAERNRNGHRIPWEIEKQAPVETWELSVGQELMDLCDASVDKAIDAVLRR